MINFSETYGLSEASLYHQEAFLAGQWVDVEEKMDVFDPATLDLIAQIPVLKTAHIEVALEKAEQAQKEWAARTAKERSVILRKWYDLMVQHQEDLAKIMVAENGKPLAEAQGEVLYGASFVEWYAEEAKRAYGEIIPSSFPQAQMAAMHQPVGICSAITPWNFPIAMITRKVAPALAAGCAMIVKPSELTPLSAFAVADLAARAGVPAGVLSIVTGNPQEIGAVLTQHPKIKKVSFTGSTAVGKILMEQAATTVKNMSMELGGNAPFLVFEDADLSDAVSGAIACKFRNAGQTCICANRLYIQESVFDQFLEEFKQQAKGLQVGNGFSDGVTMGPLIEPKAMDKVVALVEDALAKGASLVLGGDKNAEGSLFLNPTILTDVTPEMRIAQEEIFGPVAVLYKFSTEEEAVARANDTPYGLASYFYSKDVSRVARVSRDLEYGIVGVNTGIVSAEAAPFGGVKESGIGREGGKYGLDEYLEIKYICTQVFSS